VRRFAAVFPAATGQAVRTPVFPGGIESGKQLLHVRSPAGGTDRLGEVLVPQEKLAYLSTITATKIIKGHEAKPSFMVGEAKGFDFMILLYYTYAHKFRKRR
jgi:hypothetical protein